MFKLSKTLEEIFCPDSVDENTNIHIITDDDTEYFVGEIKVKDEVKTVVFADYYAESNVIMLESFDGGRYGNLIRSTLIPCDNIKKIYKEY